MKNLYLVLGFLFVQSVGLCQEKVDITTCDATNSSVICVAPTDSIYVVCVKLKPGPSANKIYKVNWGDGHSENITLNAETTTSHPYDIRSFLKACSLSELEMNISIKNTDPDNANDNKGFILTFNKQPQANPIVQSACEGSAIRFDNKSCPSTDGNITYLWEFSDGRKSTSRVPNINFTDPTQNYSVKLTATSRYCGVDTKEIPFSIGKLPQVDYVASGYMVFNGDTAVCMSNGGVLSLDGTISKEETSYEWSVTGGKYTYASGNATAGQLQVKFTEARVYTVSLIVRNACGVSKRLIRRYEVVNEPTLSITPQSDDCNPIKYKLVNPNPNAVYTFNGSPLGHTEQRDAGYSDTPYIIGATLTHACGIKNAVPDSFYVHAKKEAKITSFRDTTLCVGTAVVGLNATPAGGKWTGSFIQNQSVFNPSTVGSYEIRYEAGTGDCATRDVVKAQVAGVSITTSDESICEGQTEIDLKATPAGGVWTTTVCQGCITDNKLNISGLNVTDIKLTYSVTAPVTGGNSCSAKKDISVKIGRPAADFDISGGCSGSMARVTNKSTGASGYQWFLNGASAPFSTASNPSFTLPAGNVSIRLLAIAGGCQNDRVKDIMVATPPAPLSMDLDKTTGCAPLAVKFTMNTAERNDVTYSWNFGDGNTSGVFNPGEHRFNNQTVSEKEFVVELIAKNTCGEQKLSKKVLVRPLAKADLGVDSTIFRCSPARVKFSNRSTGNQGATAWIFGEEAPFYSSADTLSRVFSAVNDPQVYTVKLTATNSCGTDTSSVDITVYPEHVKPLFTMSHSSACAGETVSFKDATVPKPNRWLWKFGDESKAMTDNPVYSFKNPNQTYTITLIAYTTCGYDSLQRTITTTAPPKVSFDLSTQFSCEDELVSLTNTSAQLTGFEWNFGDGSPIDSGSYSPTHVYREAGSKTIILTGYGNENKTCKSEFTRSVSIREKPQADFKPAIEAEVLCAGQLIRMENLSKGATGYKWYLPDGDTLGAVHPELKLNAGFHDIALVAYYGNTCQDSVYKRGVIEVDACQIEIPDVFTPNDDNIGDYFTVYGSKGLKKVLLQRIRNRWGEILYEKNDFPPNIQTEGWDGKQHGRPVPEGEYIYEIEAEFVGGIKKGFKNNFSLVR